MCFDNFFCSLFQVRIEGTAHVLVKGNGIGEALQRAVPGSCTGIIGTPFDVLFYGPDNSRIIRKLPDYQAIANVEIYVALSVEDVAIFGWEFLLFNGRSKDWRQALVWIIPTFR